MAQTCLSVQSVTRCLLHRVPSHAAAMRPLSLLLSATRHALAAVQSFKALLAVTKHSRPGSLLAARSLLQLLMSLLQLCLQKSCLQGRPCAAPMGCFQTLCCVCLQSSLPRRTARSTAEWRHLKGQSLLPLKAK